MAWFKVDDRLPTSRKMLRIPRAKRTAAIGLWTIAGAWSAHDLTDGFVPHFMIDEFGGDDGHAEALVKAGMWEPGEQDGERGFVFVNWSEYQPVKDQVEARREYEREKKRQQRRDGNGKFTGQSNVPDLSPGDTPGTLPGLPTVHRGESAVPGPARPDPSRPGPAPKETPLPDDWAPTPVHEKKARELSVDLRREAETFKAHAEANDRRAKRWNAAFTQWLLKARPTPRGAAPLPAPGGRTLEEWEIRG